MKKTWNQPKVEDLLLNETQDNSGKDYPCAFPATLNEFCYFSGTPTKCQYQREVIEFGFSETFCDYYRNHS